MKGKVEQDQITPERFAEMRQRFLPPEESTRADEPRDCVVAFPTLAADATQLVAFDVEGRPRGMLTLPTAILTQADADFLLARVRAAVPRCDGFPPLQLVVSG